MKSLTEYVVQHSSDDHNVTYSANIVALLRMRMGHCIWDSNQLCILGQIGALFSRLMQSRLTKSLICLTYYLLLIILLLLTSAHRLRDHPGAVLFNGQTALPWRML